MKLYAESSAVLSWLLGELHARDVALKLSKAEQVLASELTLAECRRAIVRLECTGDINAATAEKLRIVLNRAASAWSILTVNKEIWERIARPFPVEPLRTLDALHLATAQVARERVPDLVVLSRDHRVRENCRQLGFDVLP